MAIKKKCPACGSTKVRTEKPEEFHHDRLGLPGVVLLGNGVTLCHCENCGNTTTVVAQEQQLIQVVGLSILTDGPGITGDQVRFLRTLFELTQQEFANAIGKRRATIAEWEAKGRECVFRKPFDEIGLRMFLMHEFTEKVIESDHCHLSSSQVKFYSDFVGSFLPDLQKLLDEHRKPKEIAVKRPRRSRSWQTSVCLSM